MTVRQWNLMGNKSQLLDFIWEEGFAPCMEQLASGNVVIGDLFCGSASVSRLCASKGVDTVSSDQMYWSHVVSRAYLEQTAPMEELEACAASLNALVDAELEARPAEKVTDPGYVQRTFTLRGNRMYYTETNGRRIDVYRKEIEKLRARPEVYYPMMAALLHASGLQSNCPGHLRAYMKAFAGRALQTVTLNVGRLGQVGLGRALKCTWGNAERLASWAAERCDIMYLDPPYNNRHYGKFYHVLETIARADCPVVAPGVTGMRADALTSDFSRRRTCIVALDTMLRHICEAPCKRVRYVILSYSSDGLMSEKEICEVMQKYADGTVDIRRRAHLRYNNPNKKRSQPQKDRKCVEEKLFVVRLKDTS